jgi:drug/metabolite transporter (DMT)-like permease
MNPMVSAFGAKNWTYIKGVTLVLLAGMFWSIGGIVVRMIEHANAWQIVFYRSLALAITLTVVILWRQRGGVLEAFRKARVIAALAGFSPPSRSLPPSWHSWCWESGYCALPGSPWA